MVGGMEAESKGWEMQEYYPPGEEDEKAMKKFIRRGLRIGKNIILTGVVISSAPFILPPLIVVSAVGLACSVPFGVFVASYACAEKLMSKLLPMPKPPPPLSLMLEYKGYEVGFVDLGSEEDVYEDEIGDEDGLLVRAADEEELGSRNFVQMSEDVDMEEEEERLLEDTKATVEMRIALPVGEEREIVTEDEYYEGKADVEEQKVDEGYQEDDESSAQQHELEEEPEAEISESEIHPMVEVLRQEPPVDNVSIERPNLPQDTHEDIKCRVVELEGPYGLTIGAIEPTATAKETSIPDHNEQSVTISLEGNVEDKGPTKDITADSVSQFTAKQRAIEIDDVHNTGVEGRIEKPSVTETVIYTPAEEMMKTSEHDLEAKKGDQSKHSIHVEPPNVKLVGETPEIQKEDLVDQHAATDATSTSKRKKKPKKKKPKSGETPAEGVVYVHPEEHEGPISSTAAAINIADDSHPDLAGNKIAEEEIHSNTKAAGSVQPNESGTTSRTPSGRSLKASPKKALFSENKIWENIEALRTIVGYRVARHQTCMEELKALYIFTGVEPPMSFNSSPDVTDSPDLVEVDEKLRFLMAIIGVK